MNNLAKALFVMGALSISIPVVAQNYGNNDRGDRYQQGRPSATFYGRNDYQGRGVTMDRPIRSFREMGLNDDISSIRIDGGRWEVCERNDFKGRCQVIDRSVRKTSTLGMNDMISSARPIGDGYGGGNGNGNGNGGNWNGGNGGGNGGGASSPLPGGSWSQSCRNAQMQGNTLRAQCNNGQGRWISTQINPRQCQSGRAGNNAGNLSCE